MWREMVRVIYEVQPRFVFVENSPMLTSRGLGRVLGDLAKMGFDAKWGVLGAADVGANHQRDRIWICAKWRGLLPHTQHDRIGRWKQQQKGVKKKNGKISMTLYTIHFLIKRTDLRAVIIGHFTQRKTNQLLPPSRSRGVIIQNILGKSRPRK